MSKGAMPAMHTGEDHNRVGQWRLLGQRRRRNFHQAPTDCRLSGQEFQRFRLHCHLHAGVAKPQVDVRGLEARRTAPWTAVGDDPLVG